MSKKAEKLTSKQKKFIEVYIGNGVQAAKDSGYKGSDKSLGVIASRLLANVSISEAIKKRENKTLDKVAMDRIARQIFWSEMANDTSKPDMVRLRASELLGKAGGDFIQKIDLKVTKTLEDLLEESYEPTKK